MVVSLFLPHCYLEVFLHPLRNSTEIGFLIQGIGKIRTVSDSCITFSRYLLPMWKFIPLGVLLSLSLFNFLELLNPLIYYLQVDSIDLSYLPGASVLTRLHHFGKGNVVRTSFWDVQHPAWPSFQEGIFLLLWSGQKALAAITYQWPSKSLWGVPDVRGGLASIIATRTIRFLHAGAVRYAPRLEDFAAFAVIFAYRGEWRFIACNHFFF